MKAALLWSFLFFLLLCTLELIAILQLNGGHFTYSLDDPYIHLALAEEIFKGNYGINPGEFCAPSSSILWPVLLAPFASLSFFAWSPLLYNILASLGSIWLIHLLLTRHLPQHPRWLLPLLIVALNLVGLTFTGMEHSLHVMLSLLTLFGLLEAHATGRAPWYLWVACVLGVWVRYEHLGLVGATSLWLLLSEQRRAAVGLFLLSLVVPLLFGGWLLSHGLSVVPSSIIAKSSSSAGLSGVLEVLSGNLREPRGWLLCLALGLLAWSARGQDSRGRRLSLWLALVVVGHLLFGRMGWFYRYEGYVFAVLSVSLLLSARGALLPWLRAWGVLSLSGPLFALLSTPQGANNIYCQQYQLHRFNTEFYQGPIAVNDIGQVALHNEQHILDLWGLASLEAARLQRTDPRWAETLVKKYHVPVIAMYAELLKEPPLDWVELGSFSLTGKRITAASSTVVIYAARGADIRALRELTRRFFEALPSGTSYILR